MARRLVAAIVLVALAAAPLGCSWMGRTAGRAQAKAERNIEAIGDGYHQGYEEERAKSDASQ